MEQSILNVDGMSCEHCVKAIQKAVGSISGVESAVVDLSTKTVVVEHGSDVKLEKIKEEIEDQGYDVIG